MLGFIQQKCRNGSNLLRANIKILSLSAEEDENSVVKWCLCDVYKVCEDVNITSPYLYCPVLSLSTCGALEVRPSILLVPGRT